MSETQSNKSFLKQLYQIKLLCWTCPPVRFWKIRCWLYCISRRFNDLNDRLSTIRGKKYRDPLDMLMGEWKADRLKTLYNVMKELEGT